MGQFGNTELLLVKAGLADIKGIFGREGVLNCSQLIMQCSIGIMLFAWERQFFVRCEQL